MRNKKVPVEYLLDLWADTDMTYNQLSLRLGFKTPAIRRKIAEAREVGDPRAKLGDERRAAVASRVHGPRV